MPDLGARALEEYEEAQRRRDQGFLDLAALKLSAAGFKVSRWDRRAEDEERAS